METHSRGTPPILARLSEAWSLAFGHGVVTRDKPLLQSTRRWGPDVVFATAQPQINRFLGSLASWAVL